MLLPYRPSMPALMPRSKAEGRFTAEDAEGRQCATDEHRLTQMKSMAARLSGPCCRSFLCFSSACSASSAVKNKTARSLHPLPLVVDLLLSGLDDTENCRATTSRHHCAAREGKEEERTEATESHGGKAGESHHRDPEPTEGEPSQGRDSTVSPSGCSAQVGAARRLLNPHLRVKNLHQRPMPPRHPEQDLYRMEQLLGDAP